MQYIAQEPSEKQLKLDRERSLMAQVARLHYIEGHSRTEIADELAISRFRVARLLTRAQETGLVSISINDSGVLDDALSKHLGDVTGLDECVVVRSGGSALEVRDQVGAAAAKFLGNTLRRGDVLGISWGRTLTTTAEHMSGLPRISVVQLAGSLSGDLSSSSVELVRRVSDISGGDVFPIFSPLIVTQAATAQAIRSQPDIAGTINLWPSVSTALLAIGGWKTTESQLIDFLTDAEVRTMKKQGAVADIAGIIIDAQGEVVDAAFQERAIAISHSQLKKLPRKIVVAVGAAKSAATIAAIRGGLVSGLIVDSDLADALVADPAF